MSSSLLALFLPALVIAMVMVVMRWAARPSRLPPDRRSVSDFDAIVLDVPHAKAMLVRARLGEADIRTAVKPRRNGNVDVLVFPVDADTARDMLAH